MLNKVMTNARTIGELRKSGWQRKSVKQEMRDNLIARLRRGEPFLPGIVGYDDTVVPQIENAILSGQDIIFLGERGQAKTRMARLLTGLLDEAIPAVAGCEIADDPSSPICQACRIRLADEGEAAGIVWRSSDVKRDIRSRKAPPRPAGSPIARGWFGRSKLWT